MYLVGVFSKCCKMPCKMFSWINFINHYCLKSTVWAHISIMCVGIRLRVCVDVCEVTLYQVVLICMY